MNKFISSLKASARQYAAVGLALAALAVMAAPSVSGADMLTRQLQIGMSGSDVSSLQTFLAQDRSIYPQGLVTGYFGFLTKAAVSNFQRQNEIESVGRVGPITLPVINLQMAQGMGIGDSPAPAIMAVAVNVNSNSAVVSWNTNQPAKGVVYYSTSPLVAFEQINTVVVNGTAAMTDASLRTAQSVSIQGLSANTTYYYMIHTTNGAGKVSVTWPATFKTAN